MKTDSQIMNEVAVSSGCLRPLPAKDSAAQKRLLLQMYCDVATVCDKYNLEYLTSGGTCLGAVRHKGFIPWDDDFDMIMPRASYEKFKDLCKHGALGDSYEIDAPNKHKDCKNAFLKVYRKNTLDVEIFAENAPGPKGIYIDVFPMDYAPRNKYVRKIKALISDFLLAASSSVLYTEYPTKLYKDFMNQSSEGRTRYRQRMILGHFFGIISHRKWVWWFDRFNACTKDTGFLTIPTGRNHYYKETLPKEAFLPAQKMQFEDIMINVPADTDAYLKALYNNYMWIPPVEKRERHFVYKFSLNTEKVNENEGI